MAFQETLPHQDEQSALQAPACQEVGFDNLPVTSGLLHYEEFNSTDDVLRLCHDQALLAKYQHPSQWLLSHTVKK